TAILCGKFPCVRPVEHRDDRRLDKQHFTHLHLPPDMGFHQIKGTRNTNSKRTLSDLHLHRKTLFNQ
ncbi:hypothetical protein ACTXT7_017103, partial [Hymenolepis weldensis]